jgi:molybdenum cofactor biosynthesis enzyme MoaA
MNTVDYLRISLIDRCNFRCQYCLPEGEELDYVLQKDLLTQEELLILLKEVFIPVGFRKFRLTGGEPLLRPGVVKLVKVIADLPETEDLSLTTNGFLLTELAQDLYDAGLRRINISLDSLDPDIFNQIIGNRGRDRWEKTWLGIQKAHQVGFDPLKLNIVIIPNVNDHEVIMNVEYYEAQLKRLEVEEKKLELSTRLKFNAQQQQFRLDQERIQLLKSLLVTAVNEENCTIFNSDNKATPVFNEEECNYMRKKVLDILKRW